MKADIGKFMGVNRTLAGSLSGVGRLRWPWWGRRFGRSPYHFIGLGGLRLGGTFLERGPGHAIRMRDPSSTRSGR